MEKINYYDTTEWQKQNYGIYGIKCLSNNVEYIGQTYESFYKRWTAHKWHLKRNKHNNIFLQNAYNKYGSDNFIFYPIYSFDQSLKEEIDKNKLNELEKDTISKHNTFNNGFNLTTGGENYIMNPLSEETKRRIGKKNRVNMTGRVLSEETKEKMSKSHKGYKKTLEHRKNLSKALTGYKRSEEQKEKCRLANQGSKQKTAKYNEEIVANIRIDYMNGITQKLLSEKYNISQSTIFTFVHHQRWKYVIPEGWEKFITINK